jgi:hypothetical protein
VASGYPYSHSLAHVGAWLAALDRADSYLLKQCMNGIFYFVGLIVVAIIVVYALGHW